MAIKSLISLALLAAVSGCATMGESNQQLLTVHAISENREIAGVGCVLSNDAGRWFTTAPGRVMVTTSTSPLSVHCSKPGAGQAREQFASRYDTKDLMGNVVTSAGVGYLIDRHSGAGFAYPEQLTVLLYRQEKPPQGGLAALENVVW